MFPLSLINPSNLLHSQEQLQRLLPARSYISEPRKLRPFYKSVAKSMWATMWHWSSHPDWIWFVHSTVRFNFGQTFGLKLFYSGLLPSLQILRLLVFGRYTSHNSSAASAKSDYHIANRSHDCRCLEKCHRTINTKHHKIAENTRSGRINRSKEMATNIGHWRQSET